MFAFLSAAQKKPQFLAQMLGGRKNDRILIINADDAGMSHGSNLAIMNAIKNGLVTSASIMVPCPWFTEIASFARENPKSDFGIHLTHTSEWKNYRWSPLCSKAETPGLYDKDGFMSRDVKTVYASSNPLEAYKEGKAQIKKAMRSGIKPTHIDSHMGAMMFDIRYAMMYIMLAKEFDLPLRIPSQKLLQAKNAGALRSMLDKSGLIYPDNLVYGEKRNKKETAKQYWSRILKNLPPGVTEIYIHPAAIAEETKAITNSWRKRAEESRLFTEDKDIKKIIESNNIKLIGYRPLMELQRKKDRPGRKHYHSEKSLD